MEAILKYLIDNKEWIFRGLGIFIIGGISMEWTTKTPNHYAKI